MDKKVKAHVRGYKINIHKEKSRNEKTLSNTGRYIIYILYIIFMLNVATLISNKCSGVKIKICSPEIQWRSIKFSKMEILKYST